MLTQILHDHGNYSQDLDKSLSDPAVVCTRTGKERVPTTQVIKKPIIHTKKSSLKTGTLHKNKVNETF